MKEPRHFQTQCLGLTLLSFINKFIFLNGRIAELSSTAQKTTPIMTRLSRDKHPLELNAYKR